MAAWMTELSNYILLLLLFFYVAAAYCRIGTRRMEAGLNSVLTVCRYLLHGYGFLVLFLKTEEYHLILFYLLQLIFFLTADRLEKIFFPKRLEVLYQNMMMLLANGLILLTRLSQEHASKQFIFAILGFSASLLIPWMLRCIRIPQKFGWVYAAGGLVLLFLVLWNGSSVFGAKNWLTVKNITFQPSEFVKILFLLSLSALLTRKTEKKYGNLLLVSIVAALHVGMLALSNDFGGALIFFSVYLLVLFVIGKDVLFPIAAVLAGTAASILAYWYSDHIQERVLAWQDPFLYIEDEGYQAAQALFAIGTGDWFGTGLYNGMPKSIPVVKSDFIFAAVSEELGILFAVLLILLFINSILWMLLLALNRKEPFCFAFSTGAVALFAVQLFLNIGGVVNMIPSTGITLSFLSYGGSSLVSTMLLFQGIQGMYGMERGKGEATRKTDEKEKKRQRHRMIFVCSGLLLLLCLMTAYFVTVTRTKAKASLPNEYNQRNRNREKNSLKGTIFSADGKILAQSVVGENGEIFRIYPYGPATAFITGRNDRGKTGLEGERNAVLYQSEESLSERVRRIRTNQYPVGNGIVTTVDMKLQALAYEVLEGYSGAVVAVEVKTGKILALASAPSYDPNTVFYEWEQLAEQEDAPLFCRALNGQYPPGSVFKIVTVLAYLEEHSEEEFSCICTGSSRIRNTTVNCYHQTAHGKQTLKEAFANSCNVAFAAMGNEISEEAYRHTAEKLGFGSTWQQELGYTAGKFALTEETSDAVRVQTAFGQGETLITPYQALMITAAIANGGILKLPYLTEYIISPGGDRKETYSSPGEIQVMSPETAELLKEYMVAASERKVTELSEAGVTVAGKTGSAEYQKEMPAHSWYVCFAPAEDPEIAICVLMESCGTGSAHALPAAKKLLKQYFGIDVM